MTHQTLNPVDAIWLNSDRVGNLMVIEALVLLDGPVDRARLQEVMQHRVVDRYPVFRQRMVPSRSPFGLPRWVDVPGFRVGDHIREVTLPGPGTEAALQDYLTPFLSRPLPRDRPLWEIHLVSGLDVGTAMYARLHHSLADGIALTRVLLSLTDAGPDTAVADRGDEPAPDEPGGAPRRTAGVLRRGLSAVPRQIGRVRAPHLRAAAATARKSIRITGKLLLAGNPTTAVSGRAGTDKRVVWTDPIPLPQVKELANRTGTTVNDVLVAALAGAVQRYLCHHDGRAVDVRTMIPVNLRPLDKPLPTRLGNRFAVVLLTLPSGPGTPSARLAETKRRMDAIKASPEALMTYGLIYGIGLTGSWLSKLVVRFFASKADAVMTNVPGPREHRYLAGTRISGLLGWVPTSTNQTLGACIFTYAGMVRVGFKTDTLAIPDPEWMLAAFHDELSALLGSPASPAPSPGDAYAADLGR
ncbi:MAG: wax ester/triacylglycerol synthase family O-acyltransferase [Nocardioides sp.]|nr:wax ester/triacylglycerol synthase family O-acyltransferase [Nocardioides sp.]